MAQLSYTSDENDLYQGGNYEPIPAGTYKVIITDSDVVVPKSGNGLMVKFTYEIITQGYENKKLFDNIVIQHANQTAETIGKQKMNTIALICGLKKIQDTAQLHGKIMDVVVGVKNSTDYGMQNVIKKYIIPEKQETAPEKPGKKPSFVK